MSEELDQEELDHQKEMGEILAKYGLTSEPATESSEAPETESEESPTTEEPVVESRQEEDVSEKRVKDAQRRMTQATQEASQLRNENAQLKAEIENLKASFEQYVKSQPQEDVISGLDKASENFELDPVVKATKALNKKIEVLEQKVAEVHKTSDQRYQQTAYERALDEVRQKHPDFQQVLADDGWMAWLSNQPPAIQRIVDQRLEIPGTSADVNWLFDQYKAVLPHRKTEQKVQQAKAAAVPNLKGQPPSQRSEIPKKIPASSLSPKNMLEYDESEIDWAT